MKWIAIVGRTLLGLLYLFSAVSFFFKLGEAPELSGEAGNFAMALMNSGFMTVIKIIEITGGLLLISGQYVRFGALWILPITVGIFLFHFLLMESGMAIPAAMMLVNLFLLYYYREDLAVVLKR